MCVGRGALRNVAGGWRHPARASSTPSRSSWHTSRPPERINPVLFLLETRILVFLSPMEPVSRLHADTIFQIYGAKGSRSCCSAKIVGLTRNATRAVPGATTIDSKNADVRPRAIRRSIRGGASAEATLPKTAQKRRKAFIIFDSILNRQFVIRYERAGIFLVSLNATFDAGTTSCNSKLSGTEQCLPTKATRYRYL